MRTSLFILTACVLVTFTLPERSLGAQRVTICHVPLHNLASAHDISISKNARESHLAHGDFDGPCADRPVPEVCADDESCIPDTSEACPIGDCNGPIPPLPASCSAVVLAGGGTCVDPPLASSLLAVAYINNDGVDGYSATGDTLIASIVDFNTDGIVSVGDLVQNNAYPLDFGAAATANWSSVYNEHFITQVQISNFTTVFVRGHGFDTFRFTHVITGLQAHEVYAEQDTDPAIPTTVNTRTFIRDAHGPNVAEDIRVGGVSPSRPEIQVFLNRTPPQLTDDTFIDVDINP